MGFCTKCGTKLNDGDLFCPNCGTRVERAEETNNNYYGDINNFPTKNAVVPVIDNSNRSHPLARAGLIVSLLGLGLIGLFFLIFGFAYGEQDRGLAVLASLCLVFGVVGCAISLGLAIPGFIITKKRGYAKGVAIAGLVLAIICASLFLIGYIWSGAYYGE